MILVTGAAGFIGFHVAQRLLQDGHQVLGIDNFSPYYDVRLKEARLAQIRNEPGFVFQRVDIADRVAVPRLFEEHRIERVIHLAAQAGVRHSIDRPHEYVDANLVGFVNILEACRHHQVQHLVYASSSSVYGQNSKVPFSVEDSVDHPISLYAATKKANELMAHTYSHLYGLPTTGLRFFTVYGPWGRPDMAYFSFTEAIMAGKPIDLYHHGNAQRDFTYIDDIVEGIVRVHEAPPVSPSAEEPKPDKNAPYRIYNIGNNHPVPLLEFVEILERCLGRTAAKNFLPAQPGDVPVTFADVEDLASDFGFCPMTPLESGLEQFVEWYRGYHE